MVLEYDGLVEHEAGLPPWWRERGNVCLGLPGVTLPPIGAHPGVPPPENARVVLHSPDTAIGSITLWGSGSSLTIGRYVHLPAASLNCGMGGKIVLEGSLSSSVSAWLDARNAGCITVGVEGLWSSNVRITTDDMHAIRNRDGVRINRRGSTVFIGRHVWLGMDCIVQPGASIGDDSIVGVRSVVSGIVPSRVIVAGVPARVIREDVSWTYEDTE